MDEQRFMLNIITASINEISIFQCLQNNTLPTAPSFNHSSVAYLSSSLVKNLHPWRCFFKFGNRQ